MYTCTICHQLAFCWLSLIFQFVWSKWKWTSAKNQTKPSNDEKNEIKSNSEFCSDYIGTYGGAIYAGTLFRIFSELFEKFRDKVDIWCDFLFYKLLLIIFLVYIVSSTFSACLNAKFVFIFCFKFAQALSFDATTS